MVYYIIVREARGYTVKIWKSSHKKFSAVQILNVINKWISLIKPFLTSFPWKQVFIWKFSWNMEYNGGTPTIYISGSQPTTTVSFRMLERHLVFTVFILNCLCTLHANYKVYRSNREVYRNSAIPHLTRWNNKRIIGHRKNMENLWDSGGFSNILQDMVGENYLYLWLWLLFN